jgi:hypothetical protein
MIKDKILGANFTTASSLHRWKYTGGAKHDIACMAVFTGLAARHAFGTRDLSQLRIVNGLRVHIPERSGNI